jgi:amino acid transporter
MLSITINRKSVHPLIKLINISILIIFLLAFANVINLNLPQPFDRYSEYSWNFIYAIVHFKYLLPLFIIAISSIIYFAYKQSNWKNLAAKYESTSNENAFLLSRMPTVGLVTFYNFVKVFADDNYLYLKAIFPFNSIFKDISVPLSKLNIVKDESSKRSALLKKLSRSVYTFTDGDSETILKIDEVQIKKNILQKIIQ